MHTGSSGCRAKAGGDKVGNKRGNKKQFLPHFNYCGVSAAAVWEGGTVGYPGSLFLLRSIYNPTAVA